MLKILVLLLGVMTTASQTAWSVVHGYTYGNANAPIKIRMYYALTCTHCKDWEKTTFPIIDKKYIQTNKVYFEMVDFPIDKLSVKVAQLAWCGGLQRYPALIKDLFNHQEQWMSAHDPLQEAKAIVMRHGLSSADCDKCLLCKSAETQIMTNVTHAMNEHKITATPAFMINGKMIDDVLTPDMLEKIVAEG